MSRLRTTFHNECVAGFQSERSHLRYDFGPRFENDADYTQRTGFLVENEVLRLVRWRPGDDQADREDRPTSRICEAICATPRSLRRRRANIAADILAAATAASAARQSRALAARILSRLSSIALAAASSTSSRHCR